MKRHLFLFAALACAGITTEIFFTAFSELIAASGGNGTDFSLRGHSYVWMFPIYGSAGLLFPPMMRRLTRVPFILRIIIYGAGIMVFEFVAGALLDAVIGRCPWEYHAPSAVLGYVRLDYFPLWCVFGGGVEAAVRFLERLSLPMVARP